MEKLLLRVKVVLACVFGVVCNALGGLDSLLSLLLTLIIADTLTRVLWAVLSKKVSSKELKKGIIAKSLVFLIIFVAVHFDKCIVDIAGAPISFFGFNIYLRNFFIIYACIEEAISLCENLSDLGAPMPKWIKGILIQVQDCADSSTPKQIIKWIASRFGVQLKNVIDNAASDNDSKDTGSTDTDEYEVKQSGIKDKIDNDTSVDSSVSKEVKE